MAKVKLDLKSLSSEETVDKSKIIETSMTGNPTYPDPDPTLDNVTAQSTLVNDRIKVQDEAKVELKESTAVVKAETKILKKMLTDLGNYVQVKSGGDEAKILSAGMSVMDEGSPIGILPAPVWLALEQGDSAGEIKFHIAFVKKRSFYSIQVTETPDDESSWITKDPVKKTKGTISGLPSGKKIHVRIATGTSAGVGGYCDPVSKYVP